MKQQKLKDYKKKLIAEKRRLEVELREIEVGNLTESQSAVSGENSYEDHFADSATATFERERDLSLEQNAKDLLQKVETALGNLEQGEFGICRRCGKEIDHARLKALPYADLCIDCKREEERW